MSPEALGKLDAVVKEIDATAKKLKQDRDTTMDIMMRAMLSPEGSAKLEAKLAVIDVQLKALAAEKARIERLKTVA